MASVPFAKYVWLWSRALEHAGLSECLREVNARKKRSLYFVLHCRTIGGLVLARKAHGEHGRWVGDKKRVENT